MESSYRLNWTKEQCDEYIRKLIRALINSATTTSNATTITNNDSSSGGSGNGSGNTSSLVKAVLQELSTAFTTSSIESNSDSPNSDNNTTTTTSNCDSNTTPYIDIPDLKALILPDNLLNQSLYDHLIDMCIYLLDAHFKNIAVELSSGGGGGSSNVSVINDLKTSLQLAMTVDKDRLLQSLSQYTTTLTKPQQYYNMKIDNSNERPFKPLLRSKVSMYV